MEHDEIRAAVLEIGAEMLGISAVSEADNFFDLGGDSLLAMKFVGKVRLATGMKISVALLMKNPELGAFAEAASRIPVLEQTESRGGDDPIAELRTLIAQRADGHARAN